MEELNLKVIRNELIAKDTWRMILEGDTSSITRPGQFINIKLEGFFLRRPISVCDTEGNHMTIIYKVIGGGTEKLSGIREGETLNVLSGLGNGFDTEKSGDRPLLIGGGVGIPPLYLLARKLKAEGKKVTVLLGFNSSEEVFFEKEFRDLGCEVKVATFDGSYGEKGFVTDLMEEGYTYFYTCGPMPMFRSVNRKALTSGEFSFEERMGCGFGACMGCSCRTITGNKRICKEGPVLKREEIIWRD